MCQLDTADRVYGRQSRTQPATQLPAFRVADISDFRLCPNVDRICKEFVQGP